MRKDKKTGKYLISAQKNIDYLSYGSGPLDEFINELHEAGKDMVNPKIHISIYYDEVEFYVSGEREATADEVAKYLEKLRKEKATKKAKRLAEDKARQEAEEKANYDALERVRKAFPGLLKEDNE